MTPFKKITGIIAPLDSSNVDTDQVIPKQFLKSIKRTGFGESLFFDWRYLADGSPDPQFTLNDPAFKGASILITRNNFGCGSSREHAVWAIKQYGFDVVIAPCKQNGDVNIPAFADIFRNNSAKNSLLTIELLEKEVDQIFREVQAHKGLAATIDLETQKIILHTAPEISFSFEIAPAVKKRLLEGLDDIGISLQYETAITSFESGHNAQLSLPGSNGTKSI
ncbi:MAG: 3-isopropylmalate dehydratase small subunit [Candidatus Omnitrophica bacterium]|nr:3-isopropylmalate dehydratase small subunit [Candidatus Omnitrophota bacterium]